MWATFVIALKNLFTKMSSSITGITNGTILLPSSHYTYTLNSPIIGTRTYTIPNDESANFIIGGGTQTITGTKTIGTKTFSSSPYNESPPATDMTEAKINSLADENKQLKQRMKRIEDEFQAIKDQLAKRSTSLAELEDVCKEFEIPNKTSK